MPETKDAVSLAIEVVKAANAWYRITEPIPVDIAIIGNDLAEKAEALCTYIAYL